MSLLSLVNQNLSETLQGQLAHAAAVPLAATRQYAQLALPALVEELARPVSLSDLNARWDMCRQLFLSQLLTDPAEWLRTDMGWPERRYYLAQNIVGEARFTALTKAPGLPEQAPALLGYLTILALATIGQHANQADLEPAALGTWLAGQQVPAGPASTPTPTVETSTAVTPPAPVVSAKPFAPSKAATLAPATPTPASKPTATSSVQPATTPVMATAVASGSKQKATMLSVIGVLVVAGLAGGYFLMGTPAKATVEPEPVATTAPTAPSAVAATTTPSPAAPAAPMPAAAPTAKPVAAAGKPTPAATAAKGTAPVHTATGAVLIDTIGNAAQANHIGGSFNAALGRYPKGEGQPLDIKLINRATISVGINSTESLLYKRLVNNNLSRPSSIPLDRLVFDLNQAKLGAEGAQQLGSIANLLKTFPKARILVLGHATTKEAEAIRLSLARANAAIDELVKQGIYAQRLQAQGVLATGVPAGNTAAEKLAMQQGISLSVSRL